MLRINRNTGERIVIETPHDGSVEIFFDEICMGTVALSIRNNKSIKVLRGELKEAIASNPFPPRQDSFRFNVADKKKKYGRPVIVEYKNKRRDYPII